MTNTPTAEAQPFTCFRCNDGRTPLYCLNCAQEVTLPALIAFKEGVIRNAPSCGACAEALFCGSTNAPHTCAIAERTALREALVAVLAYEDDKPASGTRGAEVYSQANKALNLANQGTKA